MANPDFWSNMDKAQGASKELKGFKNIVGLWHDMNNELIDLEELLKITAEVDSDSIKQLKNDIDKLQVSFTKLEMARLLGGEHDKNNAIVSIHAGAGGTESCDWVSMLFRMYFRWA